MRRLGLLAPGLALIALLGAACGSNVAPQGGGTASPSAPASVSPPPASAASPSAPPAVSPPRGGTPPVTMTVQVWFLDRAHAVTGEEPLFRPVDRKVSPPALAAGALDALFAGPTPAEQAAGLQLVLSGATGYSSLHIADGVAHVRLEGGCSSGGSTMTIAGELMPTLKQFSSVTYVKIYAPDGSTENTGTGDSIPECLEP